MSKNKPILSEAILRRQMELLGKPELADNFFSRLNEMKEEESELDEVPMEEVKTDAQSRGGQPGTDRLDEESDEDEREDEMPVDDMGDEMPVDDMGDDMEGGEVEESDVESLVQAIADAIEQHTGVEIGVEGDSEGHEEPDGDEEMSVGDVEDMEMEDDMEGDEEPMMEDAQQEAARGMPKPGKQESPEGKVAGVTGSSDKVDNAHADHKMKDATSSKKSMVNERNLEKFAEAVYRRVVRKLQEAKVRSEKQRRLLEVKKRIAERRATRKNRK